MPAPQQDTTTIRVRVQPGAARNQVAGYQSGSLRLRVSAPPERGKANQAVVALLAQCLGVARGRVKIVRGWSSREKAVAVESLDEETVRRRLAQAAG